MATAVIPSIREQTAYYNYDLGEWRIGEQSPHNWYLENKDLPPGGVYCFNFQLPAGAINITQATLRIPSWTTYMDFDMPAEQQAYVYLYGRGASLRQYTTSIPSGALSANGVLFKNNTWYDPPSSFDATYLISDMVNGVWSGTLYLHLLFALSYMPIDWAAYGELGDLELTITYDTVTACTAPSTVQASNTAPAPGGTVSLSWSGASDGTSNPITGYKIYRATTADGTYTALTENEKDVTTSATSGSLNVTAPAARGDSYYYKVVTVGTHAGYNSPQSTAYAGITATQTTAPTAAGATATGAPANSDVRLYFSGATAGNAPGITGYSILRATSLNGTYTMLKSIQTTENYGEVLVASPPAIGTAYYFKVKTLAASPAHDSPISEAYASVAAIAAPVYPYVIGKTNAEIVL